MKQLAKNIVISLFLPGIIFGFPDLVLAQTEFNPNFIISDPELNDYQSWTSFDVQKFLEGKESYLKDYQTVDAGGNIKMASDIIYDAAQTYQINPKFLLVTLQKEQSLITDDAPRSKQLDWAAGYAVCDSCSLDDPKIQKFKGFGNQVDSAAGIMRWYYDNRDKSYIKKKDLATQIDSTEVIPQSWATAFLYTYTPHLHGNKNFWRIWNTWFEQVYPNGTLAKTAESDDVWLIQDKARRRFKTKTALITRADPKMVVTIPESELTKYTVGTEVAFPNYSILKSGATTYLLDYDSLRPFASDEVVRRFGFNPQEIIDVEQIDMAGYSIGQTITASTTPPRGVIYKVADLNNAYYLLKDNILHPVTDKRILDVNFKSLPVETHKAKDLDAYQVADLPLVFNDGILLQMEDSSKIYVIDNGKKRLIADDETFKSLGYKRSNIVMIDLLTMLNIPGGETIFVNSNLASAKNKFLGDSVAPVEDLYKKASVPAYLVAEYPSGRILSGKNVDAERSIASLTKLLVAYEALEQDYDLKKSTVYDNKKYAAENDVLKLRDGEKVKNNDIFNTMLIRSVNNAARMVAGGTKMGEQELINKINARLEQWGADETALTDVTGLSEKNKSTARDVLKIFTKVISNKTIKKALGATEYSFRELVDKNKAPTHAFKHTNQLISVAGRNYRILASKTGYTEEAGAVLAMLIEGRKSKKQYVVITLGSQNYEKRFEEPNKIAAWVVGGQEKVATNN